MDVSVVIPMMNEEEGIRPLFQELLRLNALFGVEYAMEAVLVDDGSTDQTFFHASTAAGAMPFPVKVMRLNPNEGIGGALRTGFKFAIGRIVVTYDADIAYPIADALKLVRAIDQGADVATVSPYHADGETRDVPFLRLLISKGASWAWKKRLGRGAEGVNTLSAGFRAYRADVLKASPHEANGFLATTELLVRAIRNGFKVVEIPSVLSTRRTGRSKMKVARTALTHLGFMLFRMPPQKERPTP